MSQHLVAGLVQPVWRAHVGEVRQSQHRVVDAAIQVPHLVLESADLASDLSHLGDDVVGRGAALRAGLTDLAGHMVATGPQFVPFGDCNPSASVHGEDFVEAIVVLGTPYQGSADGIGLGADLFNGKHVMKNSVQIKN